MNFEMNTLSIRDCETPFKPVFTGNVGLGGSVLFDSVQGLALDCEASLAATRSFKAASRRGFNLAKF